MRKAAETCTVPDVRPRLRRPWLLALALAWSLSAGVKASTTTWPSLINYQGQLTDGTGAAVSDTAYSILFTIYDSAVGGANLWSETQPSVTTSKGLFNVILGSVTPVSFTAYTNDLWLAIKVGSDPEMTPRQQLLPAVYALNAQRLGGAQIGAGPFNIPQLNASSKLPASMIAGGSVNVPLDMTGAGGPYNLHVNNTGAGRGIVAESTSDIPVSATTASSANPAVYAEGARYGLSAKMNDAAAGVAVQAFGATAGYASLVDRVNNAEVFGQSAGANTPGILGTNSAANGVAVIGSAPSGTGVSGTGATNGVYGSSASGNALYGISTSGLGLYAQGTSGISALSTGGNFGVYGSSPGFTGVYGTGGVYGVTGDGPVAVNAIGSNVGVQAQGGPYGVSATGTSYGVLAVASGSGGHAVLADAGSSGSNIGVQGQTESSVNGSCGIFGVASGATGSSYGVRGDSASTVGYGVAGFATANAAGSSSNGVFGASSSSTGAGVLGNGFNGVKGTSSAASGNGVHGSSTGAGGNGVYGSSSDVNGSGGYFVNTAAGANGTALTADGYAVGLSATANTGYAVEASGYGGGNFTGASNYGLNVTAVNSIALNVNSTNSWGMEINAPTGYASVNYSSYGVYENSSNGRGFTGYGTTEGIYGSTSSSTTGSGVNGVANCATCYGGNFVNSVASGPGVGLYAQGYSTGVSASATSGAAFHGYGVDAFYANAIPGGINFYSDTSTNPQIGFYHWGNPTTTTYGLYDVNGNATGHAAFIYNMTAQSADTSGDALDVRGKIRATDASGKYTGGATATTTWTITNSFVEAGSIVMVTPGTSIVDPLFVTNVAAGSFTVGCQQSVANMVIYYWVVSR